MIDEQSKRILGHGFLFRDGLPFKVVRMPRLCYVRQSDNKFIFVVQTWVRGRFVSREYVRSSDSAVLGMLRRFVAASGYKRHGRYTSFSVAGRASRDGKRDVLFYLMPYTQL